MPPRNKFRNEIIPDTVKVIRASTGLKGEDIGFYKTVEPHLATEAHRTSNRLVTIANDIIESVSGGSEELTMQNDERLQGSNWKKISNTIDTLFERADLLFDDIKRIKHKDNRDTSNFTYLESSNNQIKDESKEIAKRMEKPQLKFKSPINNSEQSPFKPKLTSKPNCLVPFEESVKLVQAGTSTGSSSESFEPPHYPHPYGFEIDNQPYPESLLREGPVIPFKPFEGTTAEWIDKPEQVDQLVRELSVLSEIAVDLEHHDYRSYYGLVCLMQISNRDKDWIIDTLALRDDLQKLNVVFTNPNIVKVLHGAFMDIIWLQRDLGLYVVSLFDTYHASKKLGFPKFSLAYLLEEFAKFKTSKKYQLADWRIRPLLKPMLAYARSDTHFLLNIFDQLRNMLVKIDNNKLQEVLFESRQVAKRRFEFTKFRPLASANSNLVTCPVMASNPNEPYLSIVLQFNIPYHIRPVVAVLYNWRDELAKEMDESVRYVMPNQALALLATLSKPVDAKKVLSIPTSVLESIRNHADELAQIINDILNKLEDNDWELSHKVNNESKLAEKVIEITPQSVSLGNQILKQIYQDNSDLINNHQCEILKKGRRLFNNPIPDCAGISFHDTANGVLLAEIKAREERITKEFEKFNARLSFPPLHTELNIPKDQSEGETFNNNRRSEVIQSDDRAPNPEEAKDDIITLRKPKKQHKQKKRTSDEADGAAFNYAQTENMISSRTNESQKKKRKTFNPYSQTGTGPKPAKYKKNLHSGRSGTFKK